jgi:hypothetical protein
VLQWLNRLLPRKVVYYPETAFLGPTTDTEWKALMPEISLGYEKHVPIFRVVQILLKQTEARLHELPPIEAVKLSEWVESRKKLAVEADLLTYLLRLPIIAQEKMRNEKEKEGRRKKEEEREQDKADD